ncbi:hypothetical protein [Leucothrix arctica]|uniref:Outer membrane protein beta-barrel domain-containing protein n=1 Tax=Leucothrix arctica TaxID=1481894 RepID=A0A317CAZ8_9GAMM|nr:hypothetical protein [Leucothrix arctica]PWQ95539.1 hypothetical protein DKT75_12205 [Leucothrix arctica]
MHYTYSTFKKTLFVSVLATASLLSVANTASAEGTVALKAGTLGGGIEYVHSLSPKFAIGIGFNGFSIDDTIEESDITYDADLDMQNFSLVGDYHPFSNGFRLSAGVYNNGNEFALSAKPTENNEFEINGNSYSTDDTVESLDGLISFKSLAPYVGIGWGHKPMSGKGWGFDADLGVLFQGSPEASLTVVCVDPESTICSELQDDVDAEEVSLKEDSEEFDVYPVISLGVSYTF